MDIIHGGDIYSAEEKLRSKGIGPDGILDFSANINPMGLPASAAEAAAASIPMWDRYPDPLCRKLRKKLALWEGVDEDSIVFGAGAADLIFRICAALRPETGAVTAPSFEEYRLALRAAGSAVEYITLREENGFAADMGDMKDAAAASDLIFLCNPANPTGVITEREEIRRTAGMCAGSGAVLVVDECFMDLADRPEENTAKCLLAEGYDIIVLKAFTKTFAMAGLRLGYAICGRKETAERIEAVSQPWSVSVPAQEAALAALDDSEYLRSSRKLISLEKKRMAKALEETGCEVFPPGANYIFFRSEDENLHLALERRGILIRNCANYRGLCPGYYRVAVRGPGENDRLLEAIRERMEETWQRA